MISQSMKLLITSSITKKAKIYPNYVPTIGCDYAITPMKNYQSLQSNKIVAIQSESPAIVKATEWMKQILEAKYEKANIKFCRTMQTSIKH
jgi:hypothetical protein